MRLPDDFHGDPFLDEQEKIALEYARSMTYSHLDVTDELFHALQQHFSPEQIVELTAVVSFENFRSKFNRALRVEAQGRDI